jgi:hypothetical protein
MPRRPATGSSTFPVSAGNNAALPESEAAADELSLLARLLAFGPEAPLWEDSQERMLQVIRQAIREGNDNLLARALELTSQESTALEQLLWHIEAVAANPTVIIRGQAGAARLVVVPILITPAPTLQGRSIEHGAAFEALAGSIEDTCLVSAGGSVVLVDYLYHPTELASFLPSQLSRLAQHVLEAKQNEVSDFSVALRQAGWPSQKDRLPEASTSALGCLLAVVVEEPTALQPRNVSSDEAEEQVIAAIEAWAPSANDLLAACLNLDSGSVHVLGFDSFFDGLRFALKCLRELGLHSELALTLSERSIMPRALTILLSSYGDVGEAREVRLSVASRLDGTLLLGRAVPVEGNENAIDTIMRITRCLRYCGIEDIGVVPEVQPLEQGADAGKRVFLVPRDVQQVSGIRIPVPPGPDEEMIH